MKKLIFIFLLLPTLALAQDKSKLENWTEFTTNTNTWTIVQPSFCTAAKVNDDNKVSIDWNCVDETLINKDKVDSLTYSITVLMKAIKDSSYVEIKR